MWQNGGLLIRLGDRWIGIIAATRLEAAAVLKVPLARNVQPAEALGPARQRA